MTTLADHLTGVADAIRYKEGSKDSIVASEFSERIRNLKGGGSDIDVDKLAADYESMLPTVEQGEIIGKMLPGEEPEYKAPNFDPEENEIFISSTSEWREPHIETYEECRARTRNSEWVEMPVPEENEIYLLCFVKKNIGNNYYGNGVWFRADGIGISVEYGYENDNWISVGTFENAASDYNKKFNYNELNDFPSFGEDIKQVLVKISGTDITNFYFEEMDSTVKEIVCNCPNLTGFLCSGSQRDYNAKASGSYSVNYVNVMGTCKSITSASGMFKEFYSLICCNFDFSNVLYADDVFGYCNELQTLSITAPNLKESFDWFGIGNNDTSTLKSLEIDLSNCKAQPSKACGINSLYARDIILKIPSSMNFEEAKCLRISGDDKDIEEHIVEKIQIIDDGSENVPANIDRLFPSFFSYVSANFNYNKSYPYATQTMFAYTDCNIKSFKLNLPNEENDVYIPFGKIKNFTFIAPNCKYGFYTSSNSNYINLNADEFYIKAPKMLYISFNLGYDSGAKLITSSIPWRGTISSAVRAINLDSNVTQDYGMLKNLEYNPLDAFEKLEYYRISYKNLTDFSGSSKYAFELKEINSIKYLYIDVENARGSSKTIHCRDLNSLRKLVIKSNNLSGGILLESLGLLQNVNIDLPGASNLDNLFKYVTSENVTVNAENCSSCQNMISNSIFGNCNITIDARDMYIFGDNNITNESHQTNIENLIITNTSGIITSDTNYKMGYASKINNFVFNIPKAYDLTDFNLDISSGSFGKVTLNFGDSSPYSYSTMLSANTYIYSVSIVGTFSTFSSGVKNLFSNFKYTNDFNVDVTFEKAVNLDDAFYGFNHIKHIKINAPLSTSANKLFDISGSNLIDAEVHLASVTTANEMFSGSRKLKKAIIDMPAVKTAEKMFEYCVCLKSIELTMPELTSAKNMFNQCSSLKSATIHSANITNASYMFGSCKSLTDTSNVNINFDNIADASYMFYDCDNLENANLALSKATNASYMFYSCDRLKKATLLLPLATNVSYIFYDCYLLENAGDAESWGNESTLNSKTYAFQNCPLSYPSWYN